MSRKVEQIIEDEVRKWMYQQARRPRTGELALTWPIITVSREFGAGGSELGALLGERTGFTVWDREIVRAIAEESGCLDSSFNYVDERPIKAIDDIIHGTLMGSERTNIHYIRALVRIIRTIATHGAAVIVGRGAHYILRDEAVLRVRVVCPLDVRVQRYAEKQDLDLKQAHAFIQDMESQRREFVRLNFHRDVDLPSDYDLIVNSGSYTPDQLMNLISVAYRNRFGLDLPDGNLSARVSREPLDRSVADKKLKRMTLQ